MKNTVAKRVKIAPTQSRINKMFNPPGYVLQIIKNFRAFLTNSDPFAHEKLFLSQCLSIKIVAA